MLEVSYDDMQPYWDYKQAPVTYNHTAPNAVLAAAMVKDFVNLLYSLDKAGVEIHWCVVEMPYVGLSVVDYVMEGSMYSEVWTYPVSLEFETEDGGYRPDTIIEME